MIDYDCRPKYTEDIIRLNNKDKHVFIVGPDHFEGNSVLERVHENIVNKSSGLKIPIYLKGIKNKNEILKHIGFCVAYPSGFNPNKDKIRSKTIDEILYEIENSDRRFCIILPNANRLSEESAKMIAEICKCKNVNLLASVYSMNAKVIQRITSELKHNPLIRKLPPVKNSALKELFDKITEGFPIREDKRYKAIRSKAVKAANRSPGILRKLAQEVKEKDIEDGIEYFQEAVEKVGKRYVYAKPYMIILPIMGFGIAFCAAKFDLSTPKTVMGIMFAGLCLSIYRVMVGWAGKNAGTNTRRD